MDESPYSKRDLLKTGTMVVTIPSSGCYFTASSTKADWIAVAASGGTQTNVDTGIASSTSVTSTGGFYLFRVEASYNLCSFYIQAGQNASLANVASITTDVPDTVGLSSNVWLTQTAGGLGTAIDFFRFRVWWRDFLPAS